MIVNLHVRNDFLNWIEPVDADGRVMAMCGSRTTGKLAGVPGVTHQPAFYQDGNTGWCVRCCNEALKLINRTIPNSKIPLELMDGFYLPAMEVLAYQIMFAHQANVQ